MTWTDASIMRTRGVAGRKDGATHELTEAKQGIYHYTMGPYSQPVLHVKPGDRVVVETRDAFEGAIKTERDLPTRTLRMPFLNPQNGPIMIEGAEKGDAVAVHIESMVPRGENPRGTCCMIPEFGALTGTYYTATLNDPLPEIVRKINLDEKWVYWSDRVKLPYKPHIGTLSCSPEIDSINSLTPDNHGGNMDLPDMGPGSITYLPVRSPGGRLFIGDGHACQGDGEVCGVAVEYRDGHDHPRRADQGVEHRMAASGERGRHPGDRQHPSAGGCGAHRLPRARPVDGARLRLRQMGCLHDAQPVRKGAARQLRRSQVHRRRRNQQEVSRDEIASGRSAPGKGDRLS